MRSNKLMMDSWITLLGLATALATGVGCGTSDCADCEEGTPTASAAEATPTEAGATATPGEEGTPTEAGATATPGEEATPTEAAGAGFTARMVENPGCVLSSVVTWTTDEPASSWVEFGEGALTQRIGSDALTTDHEVVVVGMHADSTYDLQAVSESASGDTLRSQALSFETGSLPYTWMETTVDVSDKAASAGGWTIYNAATDNMKTPVVIQMLDIEGRTIWYYVHGSGSGRLDAQVTWVDGEILYGPSVAEGDNIFKVNLKGEITWEGPEQLGDGFNDDNTYHHITESLPGGGILTAQLDMVTVNNVNVVSDSLVQFDADKNVVWSWMAIDHTDQIPLNTATLDPKGEWLHINSAAVDLEGDAVYFSSLKLKQIIKLKRSTGEVLWKLGEGGDFAADPSAKTPWFDLLHAIEFLGDDRFMVYDNSDFDRRASRAVLYSLDEDSMEATLEWEFSGEEDDDTWFNNVGGDADLLDNGNTLIVGGSGQNGSTDTRLMEVTPAGEKVWQVWTHQGSDGNVSVFQADRFPALAESID